MRRCSLSTYLRLTDLVLTFVVRSASKLGRTVRCMRQTFFHLTEDLASKHFLCVDKDHKPRRAKRIEHRTLRDELQRVNGQRGKRECDSP